LATSTFDPLYVTLNDRGWRSPVRHQTGDRYGTDLKLVGVPTLRILEPIMFKFKKILPLIGQTALIGLISLGLTEIAFRIYNKINPSFIFYDLSYNRFRGQPKYLSENAEL